MSLILGLTFGIGPEHRRRKDGCQIEGPLRMMVVFIFAVVTSPKISAAKPM